MADRISFAESSGFKAFSGKPATTFFTGQIVMSGGAGVPLPAGWLWCDGSLFDVTVYPALATALNSKFNNGVEPTGFMRLPDFIQRIPLAILSFGTGIKSGSASHSHTLDTVGYTYSNVGSHTHNYNSVSLSHYHNTNGFGTTSTAAHNHGVNGVSTGGAQTRGRANGNGTTSQDHGHPVTQSNTAGGGDHNHGANGVSTSYESGNHDHGGAAASGGHTHTVSGAGLINSNALTNIPDVVSVNFMIRAL